MFLLVPAHPGSPGQRAVKRLLLLFDCDYTAVHAQSFHILKYHKLDRRRPPGTKSTCDDRRKRAT